MSFPGTASSNFGHPGMVMTVAPPEPVDCKEHKFGAWDYAEQVIGESMFIQKRHCVTCRVAEIRRVNY